MYPLTSPIRPATPGRFRNKPVAIALGAAPDKIQEPIFIGEVGRNTRSMYTNREGRPRSWIRNPAPAVDPIIPIQWQTAESCRNSRCSRGRNKLNGRAEAQRRPGRAPQEVVQRNIDAPHRRLEHRAVVISRVGHR